jgi:hypothetical protein
MKWYHYLMCLLGGAFVANFAPHFVSGITGNAFPTPFANPPPPAGVSSSQINVIWALFNLVVGYVLLRYGRFRLSGDWAPVIVAFVGFVAMAIMLASVFSAVPGVRPAVLSG